jgi:glycosyltransferase involved in cell wall biosynthesis
MKQMYCFANELTRLGHDVLGLFPGEADAWQVMAEKPRFRLRQIKFTGPMLSNNSREEIRAFQPEIVHAWTPRHIPASVVLQARLHQYTKIIVHWQDNEEYLYGLHVQSIGRRLPTLLRKFARPPLYLRMLLKPLLNPINWQGVKHPLTYGMINRVADGLTAHNPPLLREINRRFPGKKAYLLYTGVDLAKFHPQVDGSSIRQRLGLDSHQVAMYTGSINLPDMITLIEATRIARAQFPDLVFVYVGGHHHYFEKELYATVHALKMQDQVILTGEVPHKEVSYYMAAADILLQYGHPGPLNDWRLPGKILEYMAMGKPTITYATGIGEIFEDGVEVLKTYQGDAEEVAKKLQILLNDSDLARRIGANGRRRMEETFSWQKNAQHLVEIYHQVLANKVR